MAIEAIKQIATLLTEQPGRIFYNPSRSMLIRSSVESGRALRLPNGSLATWTPRSSTGRSPADTLIVDHPDLSETVDWNSPYAHPVDPDTFTMIVEDTVAAFKDTEVLIVQEKAIGADPAYALPVTTISDSPLVGVFVENMFRPVPREIEQSRFFDRPFTLLVYQHGNLDGERYRGRLRTLADGTTTGMAVVMDLKNRIGIIFGSSYMGTVKKLMFTVMNYYLPDAGVLPLHCSANEGRTGDVAIFLGLSGTGKTTLSSDPERLLIGDDEHGWSDAGIANFENGCYAKLFHLDARKEPEVYSAAFHQDHYLQHGALVENLMVYPNGEVDFDDDRYTQNSRASYPLNFLQNTKEPPIGGHPSVILFLTADAFGVLPPVARLTINQAMYWFLMGYTSKLAGTETGVVEPQPEFSRFFGAPFMLRWPEEYSELLKRRIEEHGTSVYLINTGWTGGSYPEGTRMDLSITRAIIHAVIAGTLNRAEYRTEPVFGLALPLSCPGVPQKILAPAETWKDKEKYEDTARGLKAKFASHARVLFPDGIPEWAFVE
jgi:phosphoenolpyruvate carboxykinase (ATP)